MQFFSYPNLSSYSLPKVNNLLDSIRLLLDNHISGKPSNIRIFIQTLHRNLLQLLTGTLQTTAVLGAEVLADNSYAETHWDVVENSVTNFVGQGSHFGVE